MTLNVSSLWHGMCHLYDMECVISKTDNAPSLWRWMCHLYEGKCVISMTENASSLWQEMRHLYEQWMICFNDRENASSLWQGMRHPYDKDIAISMEMINHFYDILENASSLWAGMRHFYDMECAISTNSGCVVSMTENVSFPWQKCVVSNSRQYLITLIRKCVNCTDRKCYISLKERSWFPALV